MHQRDSYKEFLAVSTVGYIWMDLTVHASVLHMLLQLFVCN